MVHSLKLSALFLRSSCNRAYCFFNWSSISCRSSNICTTRSSETLWITSSIKSDLPFLAHWGFHIRPDVLRDLVIWNLRCVKPHLNHCHWKELELLLGYQRHSPNIPVHHHSIVSGYTVPLSKYSLEPYRRERAGGCLPATRYAIVERFSEVKSCWTASVNNGCQA